MSIAINNVGRLGRQALPWFALFCLLLLATFIAVTRLVPAPTVALPAGVSAPPADGISTEKRAAALAATAGSETALVTITVRDATTGSTAQVLCRTAADRTSSDVLVMDAETARAVLPQLCASTSGATPVSTTTPVSYTRSTRLQ
jgi:hypothetical protein